MSATRNYFASCGFLEVDTPLRVGSILPERYIDAIKADDSYLITSPETQMKILLSEGLGDIFQICHAFRNDENGKLHLPEFSMLEWYRINASYLDLIDDVKALLIYICHALGLETKLLYKGLVIDLANQWDEISVDEAFLKFCQINLPDEPDSFDFDCNLVEKIEPNLGLERPSLLLQYPANFSSMSLRCKDNLARAERFELYIAGVEIGNGCSENTDLVSQLDSIRAERLARQELGKDPYPWPDKFEASLPKMPKSAGMAIGMDRLVMLFCDCNNINDVVALRDY